MANNTRNRWRKALRRSAARAWAKYPQLAKCAALGVPMLETNALDGEATIKIRSNLLNVNNRPVAMDHTVVIKGMITDRLVAKLRINYAEVRSFWFVSPAIIDTEIEFDNVDDAIDQAMLELARSLYYANVAHSYWMLLHSKDHPPVFSWHWAEQRARVHYYGNTMSSASVNGMMTFGVPYEVLGTAGADKRILNSVIGSFYGERHHATAEIHVVWVDPPPSRAAPTAATVDQYVENIRNLALVGAIRELL